LVPILDLARLRSGFKRRDTLFVFLGVKDAGVLFQHGAQRDHFRNVDSPAESAAQSEERTPAMSPTHVIAGIGKATRRDFTGARNRSKISLAATRSPSTAAFDTTSDIFLMSFDNIFSASTDARFRLPTGRPRLPFAKGIPRGFLGALLPKSAIVITSHQKMDAFDGLKNSILAAHKRLSHPPGSCPSRPYSSARATTKSRLRLSVCPPQ
jgi:hypothetical protein